MLDSSILEKYDPSGIHKTYDNWPELAREHFEKNYDPIDFKNVDHIVFSGMGGSGSICDTFASILSKTNIHVSVVKGYTLPKTVDSNTIVVAISVSGNTKETLSVLESAKKLGSKITAFSSGGKMENYCIKNNIQYRKFPVIHSPRISYVPFLYSTLNVLHSVFSIKKDFIKESIISLEKIGKIINSSNLTEHNISYNLSQWITGIPLIYYPHGLQATAVRFKNSLHENAKHHAMIDDIIETCHNGITSWERSSNVQPILLQGQDDYIKTKERWKIIKEFLDINNIDYREIFSIKGNILSKISSLIYLLDYTTIYLAVSSSIDPSPIKSIDFIKSRLSD